MNPGSFAERFCRIHRLAPEQYEQAVLAKSLYPLARWLRLLLALKRGHFAADNDFVRAVGRIARFRDFEAEALDYVHDPKNRGFLRRQLKLRVSVSRLRRLVREIFRSESSQPFGAEDGTTKFPFG